jgi:GR25 family glycosyltransferase involved in LPS biosynthesis
MEHIDVIFYINLEHRTDRKEHFLKEIQKLCIDETKVHRIDAVLNKIGIIGCAESHVKAMDEFNAHSEWNTCIIFEDDFTFKSDDIHKNNKSIKDCIINFSEWDAISLGYSHESEFKYTDTHIQSIKKIIQHQTSSGYCITKRFLPTIRNTFIESIEALYKYGVQHALCFDIYWRNIQSSANWYCIYPSLGYQYANFSDIQNTHTDYKC